MQRTYICKTDISINVSIGGAKRHLRFQPLTLGGSRLTTGDPDIQRAIESHHKFGRQITVAPQAEQPVPVPQKADEGPEVVTLPCFADAKEYLADRFGVSRTRLRTADQLYQVAHDNNLILKIQ